MTNAAPKKKKPINRVLCLACGEEKQEALGRCESCEHIPEEDQDRVEHMLLATYDFTLAEFRNTQSALREGIKPEFHPDSVLTMSAALKADKPDAHWLLFWVFFAVPIVAFIGYAIYAWIEGGPMD